MKKITLMMALLLGAFTATAQTVIVDRPGDATNGLISVAGNDGIAVYCSDYFELSEGFNLTEMVVPGFFSADVTGNIGDLLLSFNVYIYSDDGGLPAGNPSLAGTGVYELAGITSDSYTLGDEGADTAGDFTIDLTAANGGDPVLLDEGSYWVSVFPSVDTPPNDSGRWNWLGSASAAPAHESLLIDPSDLFEVGATNWTSISSLVGTPFPSFAWSLSGDPALSVDSENLAGVSVYPNPASDIVNVKIPSNVELTGVSLYDVLGKKVAAEVSNGQVNISGLSRGVYVINVETNAGTLTEKLIIE